jgi:UrcA family protein
MNRLTITMTIFALALGFQSAQAATPEKVPSVVIHYADLDLSRSEGTVILYQRLRRAAFVVCAALDDAALKRQLMFNACMEHAISTAVTQVHKPTLTAYYEAKMGDRNGATQVAQSR